MPKSTVENATASHFSAPGHPPATNGPLAIVHDQFVIRGGGERLVLELARQLNADVLTGSIHDDSFPLADLPGTIINLQADTTLPGLKTWQLARTFRHKSHSLANYHSVLYSGVAAPLAIDNHASGRNVFYCHTPPRFLYDKRDHYLRQLPPLARPALKILNHWFQPLYEHAIDRMDLVIANSRNIQQRIHQYLQREALVVYPPCDTQAFAGHHASGDFYLSTARLDPLKRIDVIIRVFKRLPHKKLVVTSGGSEIRRLKKLAGNAPNIHFTGWIDDNRYRRLLRECLATIYLPQDEDFGMSPVESMAAGKPVFCSDHGGLLETVVHEETGFYIDNASPEASLTDWLERITASHLMAMRSACQARARQFDSSVFLRRMTALLA